MTRVPMPAWVGEARVSRCMLMMQLCCQNEPSLLGGVIQSRLGPMTDRIHAAPMGDG